MDFPNVPNDPALDPKLIDEAEIATSFFELFPHYAWSDASMAIDLMRSEIIATRNERDCLRSTIIDAHRELIYLADQVMAREGGSVRRAIQQCELIINRSAFFPVDSSIERTKK